MIEVIIFTHSNLSDGFKNALEMIIGKQEKLHVITFKEEDSLDSKGEELISILDNVGNNKLVVFTDLYGASPANETMKSLFGTNSVLVTGINLPLLINVLLNKEEDNIEEVLVSSVNEAKENMKIINLENLEVIE